MLRAVILEGDYSEVLQAIQALVGGGKLAVLSPQSRGEERTDSGLSLDRAEIRRAVKRMSGNPLAALRYIVSAHTTSPDGPLRRDVGADVGFDAKQMQGVMQGMSRAWKHVFGETFPYRPVWDDTEGDYRYYVGDRDLLEVLREELERI